MSDGKLSLPYPDMPLMQQKTVSRTGTFTNANDPVVIASPLKQWDILVGLILSTEMRSTTGANTSAFADFRNYANSIVMTGSSLETTSTVFERKITTKLDSPTSPILIQNDIDEAARVRIGGVCQVRNPSITLVYIPYIITEES